MEGQNAPANTGNGFPAVTEEDNGESPMSSPPGFPMVTEHHIGATSMASPPVVTEYHIGATSMASPLRFSTPGGRRGRGRPKGSANKAKLPGVTVASARPSSSAKQSSGAKDFTPHCMVVPPGEDLAMTITSFAEEMYPKAVCVVSATGNISSSVLSQPGSSVAVLRNDGQCQIQSLSGSYTYGENQSFGMLSVLLNRPDGSIVGGRVAGPLIAATPVMLVLGSFSHEMEEEEKKPGSGSNPMAEDTPPSGAPRAAR